MTELSKNAQVPQCDKTAVMQSVINLRVGNLINHIVFGRVIIKGINELSLKTQYKDNEYWDDLSFHYGIKATEDELLKLGFEKVYDGNYKRYQTNLLETNIYLRPSLDKWYFGFINDGQDCEINDCYELEFIHEIQNLIFSLTRVSLTVA